MTTREKLAGRLNAIRDHHDLSTAEVVAMDEAAAMLAGEPTAQDYQALYHELLLAVGNKWPNETRHQTALRHIQQAERGGTGGASNDCSATGRTYERH